MEYTYTDFAEYDGFFQSIGVDKIKFIDNINIILDPKHEICDFNLMLSVIRDINENIFNYIIKKIYTDTYYCRVYYLYFKFLLLDDCEKDLLYSDFFLKLKYNHDTNKYYHQLFYQHDIVSVIDSIFNFVNRNNELDMFMDYKDNYGDYIRLDTKKIHNIRYKMDIYMSNFLLHNFELLSSIYDGIHFTYNFIFCLSDKYGYTVDRNSLIDFRNRFESLYVHSNHLMIFYNIVNISLYENDNATYSELRELYFSNLDDESSSNTNENLVEDVTDIFSRLNLHIANERNIRDMFVNVFCNKKKSIDYCDRYKFYFKNILKYDTDSDVYKLYEYAYNDSFNIGKQLYTRYHSYLNSELIQSLHYICALVYSELIDSIFTETNIELIELKKYIESVFDEFNYRKLIIFD